MKKYFLTALIASFIFSTHANANTDDNCTRLPGHWNGFYTLKNPEDCELQGGCTHLMTADVKKADETNYAILIHTAAGRDQEVTVACTEGKIKPDMIQFTCDSTQCFVSVNNASMFAELTKN